MRRIPQWVIRRAPLVLVLGAAVTAFFALQLPRLALDPSAESIMLHGDPGRRLYERVQDLFGSDRIIAVAVHRRDTIFRAPTLAALKTMSAALEALHGVERVVSLATADNLAACSEGLRPGPLFTDVPTAPDALDALRRQALANHTFVGTLVSRDARTAGLIVFVDAPEVNGPVLAGRLRAARRAGGPLPRRLLDQLFCSPTFAQALWEAMAAEDRARLGSPAGAIEQAPELVGRLAARLLRDDRSLRRTVVREAPAASRRRLANLIDQVHRIARDHAAASGDEVYFVGNPVLKVQGARHQRRDLARLLPCTLLVVAVVLVLAFRSAAGVLIPLGAVLVSVVWTFGLMALLGVPLTFITLIIGPLLIAVGSSYAMHIVSHYHQAAGAGGPSRRIALEALERCFLPVLLAGATTLVGFLSVTTSRLASIREFGLFSAFGILSAVVVALTLAPAVLRYLPPRGRAPQDAKGVRSRSAGPADRILRAIGRLAATRGTAVAVGGGAALALALVGCLFVQVNTTYTGLFHRNDPVRVDSRRIHEQLSGATPLSIVVDARGRRQARGGGEDEWRGPLTEPAMLRFLLDLQRFLAAQQVGEGAAARPAVDKAVSMADHVRLMYQSFSGDRSRELPATRGEVEELLDFFYSREEADKYVSDDFAEAHIYVRTEHTSSRVLGELADRVEAWAAAHGPQGVEVAVTGETILIMRAADEIAGGQVRSLAIAAVVIFSLMAILFTSAKAGLLAIIPTALPIVGTFGLMGWLGVDLNVGTSLVASVALGIAVDDTIHYMTGFHLEMRRLGDQPRAMLATLYLRGRAMVFTSVALFFGFAVLTASRFAPIASFGYLTAIAMVAALLGDLLVLPVLVQRVELVTVWDLLASRLGGRPEQWLGILRGLTRPEARRVALLSTLRRLPRGARLQLPGPSTARRTQPVWSDEPLGRTLLMVFSGRVELRAGPRDALVAALGPGQVFGEASPEYAARAAHAVATDDAELLTLDERSLQRLARRYPRVAAKLLANLVFLLADRLSHATASLPASAAPGAPAPPRRGGRAEPAAIGLPAPAIAFEPDQPIDPPADGARQLLLIASGGAIVTAGQGPGATELARLAQGDVIAAGAAAPQRPAEAGPPPGIHVRAVGPTEVLVITEPFLQRLAATRPRLAARWSLHVARLLARRLDETVARIASAALDG